MRKRGGAPERISQPAASTGNPTGVATLESGGGEAGSSKTGNHRMIAPANSKA